MAAKRSANVYPGTDLTDVMRLRGLLGESAVQSLPLGHPLTGGFLAAREKLKATRALSVQERQALAELKLFARPILQLEPDWQPSRERFIGDLINPDECLSLLFELHVMIFALQRRVQQVNWTRYGDATPDIRTSGPEIAIECTLHRSDKTFRVQHSLETKRAQHRGLGVPFVIAVGFHHQFTDDQTDQVARDADELRDWFMANPDVSAGLIFTPSAPSDQTQWAFGFPATQIRHGSCTQIIHHKAVHPLPKGFDFGE